MHLYKLSTGEPVYDLPLKTDPSRTKKPTLREMRSGEYAVGTTTIIGQWRAPQLEDWKVQQGILAALTCPDIYTDGRLRTDITTDNMLYYIRRDMNAQSQAAMKLGSTVHSQIEKAVQAMSFGHDGLLEMEEEYRDIGAGVFKALANLRINLADAKTELCFAHPLGFGGAIDLCDDRWVIDFKTKDFTEEDVVAGKVKAYDNHRWQIVAYDVGSRHAALDQVAYAFDWRRHANIFISTNPACRGLTHTVIHDDSSSQHAQDWLFFYHLVLAWLHKNNVQVKQCVMTC